MEKYKKTIKDKDISDAFEHIFQNATGNPIVFEMAPTKATMNANTWGVYSGELYFRFANGLCYKVTLTAVS